MKKLLVCPVCGSTDVELDTGGYTGKYFCKECGYTGSYILEMTEGEYKEFRESEKFERMEKFRKEKKHEMDYEQK
jgi:transcription initiation factor TFIIIB Brf1 subunit/transcription initiation factor TFIIB